MKKLIFIAAAVLFLVPAATFAATFQATENGATTIKTGETVKNGYLAGNSVNVDGTVKEDLVAAGNTVTISGDVNDSANVAGNSITIDGKVGKSVRAAGSNVNINNSIGSDALAAGSTVNLGKDATVADDFSAAGAIIELNGTVNGKAYLAGGQITINGKVNGDVIIKGAGKVTISDKAVIGGNLTYSAQEEASIASGAKINGTTTFNKVTRPSYTHAKLAAAITVFSLGAALALYILLLILVYVFPRLIRKFVDSSFVRPLENIGMGFAYLVLIPIAALIIFFTLIGIPISLLGIGIYAVTLGLAKVLVPLLLGSLIFRWLGKEKVYRLDWLSALVGIVASIILGMIPIIGSLALFILFLIALSQFAQGGFNLLKAQR